MNTLFRSIVLSFCLSLGLSVSAREWTPSNSGGQPWQPKNPSGREFNARNTDGQGSGLAAEPEVGGEIFERNSKIRESRKALEEIVDSKGYGSKDYKKASEELNKLRKERDELVEQLPEGQGMRYKMRRSIGADKIKERREQESFENYKKEKSEKVFTAKEKLELEGQKEAKKSDKTSGVEGEAERAESEKKEKTEPEISKNTETEDDIDVGISMEEEELKN